MENSNYDFSGWATKNDLLCSDGRTIRHNAFKDNDGCIVPLVWNHLHDNPENILGQVLLENRDNGVYCYGLFNDTSGGQVSKVLVQHGDIDSLSICANRLKQVASDVIAGNILEVSLVPAGANPGALIDTIIEHSDDEDEEAIIYSGITGLTMHHSDDIDDNKAESSKEESDKKERTLEDVINTFNEEQLNVLHELVGAALVTSESDDNDETKDTEEGGKKTMKHNVFDREDQKDNTFLSHAEQADIINMAKSNNIGNLKTAISMYMEDNDSLEHGIESIETLFPEYQDVRPGAPEMLTTDQGWIGKVMQKVHKSPISRIRTRQADIRNIENLRAHGYKKGEEKKETENFQLLHRTTDPQTVYVKSRIDRDDVIDITDFDVVGYLYNIDRMNLNEELATAIMIGDGREVGDDDKIMEDKIRPIWGDDDLYTIHVDVDFKKMKEELQGSNTSVNFGENYIYAESIVQSLLYAREKYKGSGLPDFYCTPHLVNIMLMARDLNGRRIYDNVNDLKATLNVNEIITVEQFANRERKDKGQKKHKLLGIMVNLADYYVGSTKGGEITHFTDFDIDFNQLKSLLETRCSGANTRPFSAIALEEPVEGE